MRTNLICALPGIPVLREMATATIAAKRCSEWRLWITQSEGDSAVWSRTERRGTSEMRSLMDRLKALEPGGSPDPLEQLSTHHVVA